MGYEGQSPGPDPGLPDLRTELFTPSSIQLGCNLFLPNFWKILTKYLRDFIRKSQPQVRPIEALLMATQAIHQRGGAPVSAWISHPIAKRTFTQQKRVCSHAPMPKRKVETAHLPGCHEQIQSIDTGQEIPCRPAKLQWHFTGNKLFSSVQRGTLGVIPSAYVA